MTSLHSTDELARAREVGISAYLSKPVRRQELYRALAQAVGEAPISDTPAHGSRRTRPRIRARVLMAEDNGVNQVVARNMLKSLGCEFEIVPNGQEALLRGAARRLRHRADGLPDAGDGRLRGDARDPRLGAERSRGRAACRSSR